MKTLLFFFLLLNTIYSFSFKEQILKLSSEKQILSALKNKIEKEKYPKILIRNKFYKLILINKKIENQNLIIELNKINYMNQYLFKQFLKYNINNKLYNHLLNEEKKEWNNNLKNEICKNNLIKIILNKNINVIYNINIFIQNINNINKRIYINSINFIFNKKTCK